MRVKYNMFLFQLDDEPNLYLGNGWKSPVPSIKKMVGFRVPITSPNTTTHPWRFNMLHLRISPWNSRRWTEMGVSKNRGTQKCMVYNGKPSLNGWFGGTHIFGNIQIGFSIMASGASSRSTLGVNFPARKLHHHKSEARSCFSKPMLGGRSHVPPQLFRVEKNRLPPRVSRWRNSKLQGVGVGRG